MLRLSASSRTLLLATTILFLLEASDLLLLPPKIRLLEARLCRRYYDTAEPPQINLTSGDIDEKLCKIPEIQAHLASIRGWQVVWDAVPVLMVAMQWGRLADRIGAWKVLAINYVGNILYILIFFSICIFSSGDLPTEYVWLSAVAYLLGGGPRTASVLILAMVINGHLDIGRSQRIYYTYSAFLLSELLAPPIASSIMKIALWLSFAGGVMVMCLSLIILFISGPSSNQAQPEPTALPVGHSDQHFTEDDPLENEHEVEDYADLNTSDAPLLALSPSRTVTNQRTGLLQFLKPVLVDHHILKLMSSRAMIPLLVADFLCPTRLILVFEILIPFISIRYDKEIAQANVFISIIAATNLVCFCLILPRATGMLASKFGFPAPAVDALVSEASAILLILGCVWMAVTTQLLSFVVASAIFAAGFGFRFSLLSLITSLVDSNSIGQVYTLVAVLEAVGGMVEGLGLQKIFEISIKLGGDWLGGPFMAGALVYFIALVCIIVRHPRS